MRSTCFTYELTLENERQLQSTAIVMDRMQVIAKIADLERQLVEVRQLVDQNPQVDENNEVTIDLGEAVPLAALKPLSK